MKITKQEDYEDKNPAFPYLAEIRHGPDLDSELCKSFVLVKGVSDFEPGKRVCICLQTSIQRTHHVSSIKPVNCPVTLQNEWR